MNNMPFGRYTPFNSPLHKLDARNKILLVILFMAMIFLKPTMWGTTVVLTCGFIVLLVGLLLLSRCSFLQILKSLKGMWILILFLFLIYILVPNNNYYMDVAFKIGDLKVRWDAFYQAGYIVTRLIIMLGIMMVLTSTTTPMNLTYALEWYFTPLRVVKFPVHEMAMTMSIALRFIPTLMEETDRIMKAQASRGVNFNRGGLFKRFRALSSLIIPLFVSAIQRSEELADAMEARGYDPKSKRTRYRKLKFGLIDLLAFIIMGSLFAGVLYLYIYDRNVEAIDIFYTWFKVRI